MTNTQNPTTDLISGEWLMSDDNTFHTVYEARITGWYSFGCSALVSRSVMEAIVKAQDDVAADSGPDVVDVLVWDGDNVIHTAPIDLDFVNVITPDADGLYEVPGWTWCRVNPETDKFSCVVS
jgi:hypothetical protein